MVSSFELVCVDVVGDSERGGENGGRVAKDGGGDVADVEQRQSVCGERRP